MATKTIKKVTLEERVDRFKENVSEINDQAIIATDKLVEISLKSGAKWQKLMSKVIDRGTDLFEKQTDLTLDILEGVKDQYTTGNKQFRNLLGLNESKAKKAKRLQKKKASAAKKAVAAVETSIEDLLPAKNDLKALQGIGPKVEGLLNNAGIHSYEDLANASVETLQNVLQDAGSRYQSMDPSNWIVLAQEALAGPNNK
ncbi:MAG: helix-hairpin-helix domain-containing protein [Bacteroidota bacterium]